MTTIPTAEVKTSVLIYAFRYALNHSQYAAKDTIEALLDNRDRMTVAQRASVEQDIRLAVAHGRAGVSADVARWTIVADAMLP